MFSDKSHSFLKKVKFWTFWEILFFKVHSTENFQLWLFYKNSRFFLKNSSSFFKKPEFWTFWVFSVFQSQITANLLLWGILKNQDFSKNVYFFRKTAKIWPFSELSLFQSDSTANLILSEILKILKTVFQKIRNFFRKTPILEHFEKSYYFNCILQEIS